MIQIGLQQWSYEDSQSDNVQVSDKSAPLAFWISWTKIIDFFLTELIESWQTLLLSCWDTKEESQFNYHLLSLFYLKERNFCNNDKRKEIHNPRK